MFTNYPTDRIHDVAFATTIRTNYASNSFVKIDDSFICKTLESLDFQTL